MSSDYVSFREIQIRNEMQTPEVLRAMRNNSFDVQTLQNEENPLANLYKNTYKYLEYPSYSDVKEREIVRQSINDGKERPKLNILKKSELANKPTSSSTTPITNPSKPNPFGNAKPVDTAAKLKQLEEEKKAADEKKKELEAAAAAPPPS